MPLLKAPEPPPQTDPGPEGHHKLGRLAQADARDYDARALMEGMRRQALAEPIIRGNAQTYLPPRKPLTQKRSSCVLHAVAHRILGAPNPWNRALPFAPDGWAYDLAQAIDEWDGGERPPARSPGQPYYEGTSVRAGLELLRLGYPSEGIPRMPGVPEDVKIPALVHSYWKLKTWDSLLDYCAARVWKTGGSVAWGTNWSSTMFKVDGDGYLYYDRAKVAGGHATMQYYANIRTNRAGFQNSWGTDPRESGMAYNGRYYTRLDGPGGDTQHDLYDDDGDAYAVVEVGTPLAQVAALVIAEGALT